MSSNNPKNYSSSRDGIFRNLRAISSSRTVVVNVFGDIPPSSINLSTSFSPGRYETGSFIFNQANSALYMRNFFGSWEYIGGGGGGGGGGTLAQTLALGNTTGVNSTTQGNDIIFSYDAMTGGDVASGLHGVLDMSNPGDSFISLRGKDVVPPSTGDGSGIRIIGGDGNPGSNSSGGSVRLVGGTSGGAREGGEILLITGPSLGSGQRSGDVTIDMNGENPVAAGGGGSLLVRKGENAGCHVYFLQTTPTGGTFGTTSDTCGRINLPGISTPGNNFGNPISVTFTSQYREAPVIVLGTEILSTSGANIDGTSNSGITATATNVSSAGFDIIWSSGLILNPTANINFNITYHVFASNITS